MVEANAKWLIVGFIALIIGSVLIGVLADNTVDSTDKLVIEDGISFTPTDDGVNFTEVHTVTQAPTGWKQADCPLTNFVLKNATGGTALTVTTDYVVNLTYGTYTLVNTTDTRALISNLDNKTYASYTYCGDDYLNLGWGRTVLNLNPGFYALAILGAALIILYGIWKYNGISQ